MDQQLGEDLGGVVVLQEVKDEHQHRLVFEDLGVDEGQVHRHHVLEDLGLDRREDLGERLDHLLFVLRRQHALGEQVDTGHSISQQRLVRVRLFPCNQLLG